eukprot:9893171-Heterocapsa_arctica.AAC.1
MQQSIWQQLQMQRGGQTERERIRRNKNRARPADVVNLLSDEDMDVGGAAAQAAPAIRPAVGPAQPGAGAAQAAQAERA